MNTMNRCKRLSVATLVAATSVLLAGASLLFPSPAQAQASVREFPRAALRGELLVTAPPEARLNGRPDRLSPGARIRSPQNQQVMSGAIVGQALTVNYVRDGAGMIHEVWILNAEEISLKRPGAVAERNFVFESEGQKPARDDGKTPFNQLPVYPKQ
jgi:hypothetical protein